MGQEVCCIDGCMNGGRFKRGMCSAHYQRWRTAGGEVAKPAGPTFCSVDGCKKLTEARGLCPTHYRRWQRHGDPLDPGRTADRTTRFWRHVDKSGPGGCWVWTGALQHNGYGHFHEMRAHRFSWVLANGEIPEGLFVCHRCDNPPCVNPDHLFLGTHNDNMADMSAKDRRARGEWSPNARLSDDAVRSILASTNTLDALAKEHGVTKTTIARVRKRRAWKHLG